MVEQKSKAVKYVVLFIVCLLLMLFGSLFISAVLATPLHLATGYNAETLQEALTAFGNYFSNEIYQGNITWHEYAEELFSSDPALFESIKTFYCAIQFLSYVPMLVLIIYFLREEFAEDFINFKKNIKKNLLLVLIGFVAMYVAALLVNYVYEIIGVSGDSANESTINLMLDSKGVVLMVIAVVLLAPICEEVIFRKLLFGTCEVTCKFPPIVAIIVSALVFSFIHVSDLESLKFIFQYLALALPICIIYHKSNNNIYVTIIMHILNNGISVLFTLIQLGK